MFYITIHWVLCYRAINADHHKKDLKLCLMFDVGKPSKELSIKAKQQ
jgi:hypothetical protein